jgi:hypothetical protein
MSKIEVASDPSTSHEELRRLVQTTDSELLRAIAKNPNIPRDLVVLLLRPFPYEIVANPVWQLLLLENPGFVEREMSQFAISKMLDEQELPEMLVGYFSHHRSAYIRKRVVAYQERMSLARAR